MSTLSSGEQKKVEQEQEEAKVEAEEMKNQEKEEEDDQPDGNAKRPSSSAEIGATAGPVRRRERHMHARLKRTALQFLCNIYMGSQDVRKVPAAGPQVDEGRSGDDSLHSLRTALPFGFPPFIRAHVTLSER